jgi:hypothetical protein
MADNSPSGSVPDVRAVVASRPRDVSRKARQSSCLKRDLVGGCDRNGTR